MPKKKTKNKNKKNKQKNILSNHAKNVHMNLQMQFP